MMARQFALTHTFQEIRLLPKFIGEDGRPHSYGNQFIDGSCEIIHDNDEDWWIAAIWLETDERIRPHDVSSSYRSRELDRSDPIYPLIRAAIERECEEDIAEQVRLNIREEEIV